MNKPRTAVTTGTHLGAKAFYAKDRARADRANQTTALPPRCVSCRLPGRHRNPYDPEDVALYCDRHVPIMVTAGPFDARQCPICQAWVFTAAGPFDEHDGKSLADFLHWQWEHATEEEATAAEVRFPYFEFNDQPVQAVRERRPG